MSISSYVQLKSWTIAVVGVLSLFCFSGLAQTAEVDSLKQEIRTTKDDSIRISCMTCLSSYLIVQQDVDSGIYWLQEAQKLAHSRKEDDLRFLDLEAYAIMREGIVLIQFKDDNVNSVKKLREAAAIYQKTGNDFKLADCWTTLGIIEMKRGNFDQAVDFNAQALEVYQEQGDSTQVAMIYNNFGLIATNRGQYAHAIEQFHQALRIREAQTGEDGLREVARLYHNICALHTKLENDEKAIFYNSKSMAIRIQLNDSIGVASSYNLQGTLYRSIDKFDSSLVFLQMALDYFERHELVGLIVDPLNNIGLVYLDLQQPAEALPRFERALSLARGKGYKSKQIMSLINRSLALIQLERFDEAIAGANEALILCNETGANNILLSVYEILHLSYEAGGQADKALKYHRTWINLKDSILSVENRQNVAIMEAEFKAEQQQREIEQQESLIDRNEAIMKAEHTKTVALLISVIALLIIVMLIYRSYHIKTTANKVLQAKNDQILNQKEKIETQANELEVINQGKDKLFSIIAHDLRSPFHTLQGILSLIASGDLTREETDDLIQKLSHHFDQTSGFLDNLLNWSKSQMGGTVVQSMRFKVRPLVDGILQLFQKRAQSKQLQFSVDMRKDLELTADPNMIELVLRNLIVNAIKFSEVGGNIKIEAEESEGFVLLRVKDEGVGMEKELVDTLFSLRVNSSPGTMNELGAGLGLVLSKDFVEMNKGKIRVSSKPGKGSCFEIKLPQSHS